MDWYCAMYSGSAIALMECVIISWVYGETWMCSSLSTRCAYTVKPLI